jgi:hypothetical protein
MAGGQGGGGDDGTVVLVPAEPGRLVRPGRRSGDGLDDLIDELLPDTDEGPGPTDVALLTAGAAVMAWTVFGSPPAVATVAGVAALGLGSILPLRSAWRWRSRRRRSSAARLRTDDAGVARLVAAYEALDQLPATTGEALAAAHGALLEVASLLDGRTPASDAERRYVAARVAAVEALVTALREIEAAGPVADGSPAPELVVEAREELDALGGVSALSRLGDVTADVRARGRRH